MKHFDIHACMNLAQFDEDYDAAIEHTVLADKKPEALFPRKNS